ncbi:hypothetical protein, partial [Sulfitobacter litoralis]|uniref:hypothetical protein n=1 Tax=Sulfitobacter litoralis TaxID=335975 RepID=UPI0030EE09F3
ISIGQLCGVRLDASKSKAAYASMSVAFFISCLASCKLHRQRHWPSLSEKKKKYKSQHPRREIAAV